MSLDCQGCEAWCEGQPCDEAPECPQAEEDDKSVFILVIVILTVFLMAETLVLFFARTKLNRIFSDPRNVIVSEISEYHQVGKSRTGEHPRNIGAHVVVDHSPIIRETQEDPCNNQNSGSPLRSIDNTGEGEPRGSPPPAAAGAISKDDDVNKDPHHAVDMGSNQSGTTVSSSQGSSTEGPSMLALHEQRPVEAQHDQPKINHQKPNFQTMHAERSQSGRRASIGEKLLRRLSVVGTPNEATPSHSWEINLKDLKFRKKIGEGGYGTIYLGEWLGTEVAIKTVKQALCKRETFLNEVQIMSTLHHPNIVIFMGASLNEKNICMVMEYMEKGDMQQFLKSKDNKPLISMHLMHRFAIDIARGMKYLHHRVKMIQRDLKSDNLLIDSNYNCKICDFGLTRYIDHDGHMTACGTPYWTAPEVIRQEPFDHKADVYSYGIVLWELLTQKEPYGGMEGIKVAYAVADSGLRPNIPSVCPEGWDDLMQECWHDNPEFRPDFGVILDRLVELKKEYQNIDFVSSGENNKTNLGAHRKSVAQCVVQNDK